jgi:ABC-type uncharacterized transport system ATPase subunit
VNRPTLSLSGITRRFGALTALDDASLNVRPGSVHALLGENGAGKTTLMRIAFGMMRPDAGRIEVDGRERHFKSPADAIAAGIGMVHQHFTLVPTMTVAENVALGGHGLLHRAGSAARVRDIASRTGFALDPDMPVERLSVGAQQRVEIAKALARQARLLILDEPTAVLAPAEADELLRWVREYAAQGNSAVLITHKLREALAVADDVTVLRRGRVVHAGRADAASEHSLTASMLGASNERVEHVPPESAVPGAVVFRVERLVVQDERGAVRVRDAAFSVRSGEIVGLAGVEGAGHRELLRALAGRLEPIGGMLVRPQEVGFIPEDRHHDAVLLDRSLTENVALRGAGTRRGMIGWAALRARTTALMQAFDVRAPGAEASMRVLSGGNQQKLVLARELEEIEAGHETDRAPARPMAIVAENPTRGLDVRATADVHARLRAARDRGAAIVLYSSDLQEVLSLASRMLVAYAGTIREVALDRDAAGRAMLGISG